MTYTRRSLSCSEERTDEKSVRRRGRRGRRRREGRATEEMSDEELLMRDAGELSVNFSIYGQASISSRDRSTGQNLET